MSRSTKKKSTSIKSAYPKPKFKPNLINHYVLVYNDGHAARVRKGKVSKAKKAYQVKYFESKKQAKQIQAKHPELGLMKITSIIGMEEVE